MKRATTLILTVFAILASARDIHGQIPTGTPPFGTYGGGPFDTVNLGNLNVHLVIPIRHKAGRGSPFAYDLTFDNVIWYPTTVSGQQVWQPNNTAVNNWGWGGLGPVFTPYVSYSVTFSTGQCYNGGPVQYSEWLFQSFVYHDDQGVSHLFATTGQYYQSPGGASCPPQGQVPTTIPAQSAPDGSGFILRNVALSSGTASGALTKPDGTAIVVPWLTSPPTSSSPTTSTDANGNQISESNAVYTDTLGTTVLTAGGTAPSNTNFTYAAPSGANASYVVSYHNYTVTSAFGCSGIREYNQANQYLVDRVTLPDATFYQFNYEPTYTGSSSVSGRLASVTLPAGGTVAYQYSNGTGTGTNAINCTDGTTMTLTRTLIPGGDWIYARASVSGTHWQTTMSSPADPVNSGSARNVTVIDFQQESTTTKNFYETQRLAYQGTTSGTLLQTTVTCYNGNTANCNTTAVTLPISRRTVFVQLPNAAGLQSRADSFYDTSSGMLTEVDQYGYGSGAPGSLLRKTTITYASLGNNILNRPSSVLVQDNSSPAKTLSQTTYTYDEGTPTATTGTPQHVAVTGSRGNATTITTSVGGSSLTRHLTYYDTGNVNQSTDVNGAVTTYNYASGNPSCSNSFPTSITLPISGLSQSMSWNCTGAVQTSATDANGNTTHTNFTTDTKFWRPESLQDAAGNVTALTYTGQTQVEAALSFNGGNSAVDALSVLDGLSRASVRQQRQAPGTSNFDSAQQTYDALGRPNKGTMPYLGTSIGQGNPQGTPATTATYDALWRPLTVTDGGGGSVTYTYTKNDVLQVIGPQPAGEHTKNKQLEYDALGRLISVCEVTTGGVSGACNQQNAQNGYLTTYVYDNPTINSVVYNRTIVTQNAQTGGTPQTRTLQYDLLGRLVSEANPESGTASYVYDTDATCGTSKGDLVKRTDAAGNVTCYSYDSLHRKTLIAYPSGPNASVSHEKVFYYDTSYSQPTVNVKGRLAAAGTCLHSNDCAGNWQTLEEFSYSPRGETTDVYERTPNSGGVYHVTASYWAHGLLKSLSGVPSVPTLYYGANDGSGLDGEGRLTKVTASSGQNPVTGITYTNSGTAQPIGSLTQLTFGSADFDNFSYDVNTGRMSQYQFHVASQTDTGTLTRNANGTLQQLAITDQINTSNSQTCTFGHDDLARIASVSCGTTWSQTFSFDPFGNISKSGSITFLPTYNLATNRFQTIPGGTPTYDANGNLTYDLSHNYSWDAEGKALTIDSVGLTYDALGRMVEQARGSSYTEIVYGPSGSKLALMNGQTLSKAFMPLPSGATAVYTASGLAYYRHADWLGSARLASTPSRGVYFDGAYAPYGEDYAKSGTTDLNFTGQNQDTVSGLYDFMYREYHAVQGRWISPDPAGLGAVSPASPQSWNRYAYVSNNPLSFIDPLGLFQCAGATCPPPPHPTDPSPYLDEWWGWGSGSPTDGPLSMIFRGGQKGGGTSSCTITVTIFNSANLSQEQFSAIEQQISDLFSAPGIAPGGLGVTFEEGNVAAPHQLNLSGGFGPSLWEDNWGVGKGPPLFPTAQVFLAKIAFDMTPEGYPMSLEQMFGTVGAHELAHDYLPDSPRPTSPTDIMGVGFMSFAEMSSALGTNQLGFTFSEASRMFQGCMSTQAP